MEPNRNIYSQRSKTVAIILGLTIILCIISTELAQWQLITDFNYNLHEILYLPLNLCIYLIPLEFVCLFITAIQYMRSIKKGNERLLKIVLASNFSSLFLLALFIIYFTYFCNSVNTSGCYEDIKKATEYNKYYILIENKKVFCTRNEFNLIDSSDKYLISYNWNKLFPDIGRLDIIKVID